MIEGNTIGGLIEAESLEHFGVILLEGIKLELRPVVVAAAAWRRGLEIAEQELATILDQPVDLGDGARQSCAVNPMQHEADDHEIERLVPR